MHQATGSTSWRLVLEIIINNSRTLSVSLATVASAAAVKGGFAAALVNLLCVRLCIHTSRNAAPSAYAPRADSSRD